ncbi:MAG: NHL repeat-containing protein [Armatimonadota bacterium]
MRKRLTYLALASAVALAIIGGGQTARAAEQIKMNYLFAAYGYSSSQRFLKPGGLFYDTNRGELYVADTGNGQIVILDKKGMPLARIPHSLADPSTGDRKKGEPRSIVVRKNGDILVVDNQCNYVDVLDPSGRSVEKLWPGDLVGQAKSKVQPRCIAQDSAGNLYIGVNGNDKEILVVTPGLKLKTQIGVESSGGSKGVTGLWVDKTGRIYATYGMGECVRIYGSDGKQMLSFGAHDSGPQNFSLPSGLVTDKEGRMWVVDTLRHVVSVFKLDQADQGLTALFLSLAIGGMGQNAGDLTYPSGIAGDGSNLIFVLESTGARVQAFGLIAGQGSKSQ